LAPVPVSRNVQPVPVALPPPFAHVEWSKSCVYVLEFTNCGAALASAGTSPSPATAAERAARRLFAVRFVVIVTFIDLSLFAEHSAQTPSIRSHAQPSSSGVWTRPDCRRTTAAHRARTAPDEISQGWLSLPQVNNGDDRIAKKARAIAANPR
jgi:hypothetical protein